MLINNHPPSSDKQPPGSTPATRRTLASELCVSAQTDGAANCCCQSLPAGPAAEATLDMRGAASRYAAAPPNSGCRDCPSELNALPVATTTRSLILANRDRLGYSSSRYLPVCNYATRIRHGRSCK